MKKLHIVLMSVSAIVTMLCSCSTIRHTSHTAPVNSTVTTFTVADLDVAPQKVTKTYSWSYNPFKPVSIETVKTNTTAALLNETGTDILVEPEYIVEKRGFLRGGSVTVIGFPAKFKNFHTMTPEEAEIVKNASYTKPEGNKHKRFWIF